MFISRFAVRPCPASSQDFTRSARLPAFGKASYGRHASNVVMKSSYAEPTWEMLLQAKDAQNELLRALTQAKDAHIHALTQAKDAENEMLHELLKAKEELLLVANRDLMILQGLLDCRGVIEFTENRVVWPTVGSCVPSTRQRVWEVYLALPAQKILLTCLKTASRKNNVRDVSYFMADLYGRLSSSIHGSESTNAPSSYIDSRSVLIARDLPADNEALICLCKTFHYPYRCAATLPRPADKEGL